MNKPHEPGIPVHFLLNHSNFWGYFLFKNCDCGHYMNGKHITLALKRIFEMYNSVFLIEIVHSDVCVFPLRQPQLDCLTLMTRNWGKSIFNVKLFNVARFFQCNILVSQLSLYSV